MPCTAYILTLHVSSSPECSVHALDVKDIDSVNMHVHIHIHLHTQMISGVSPCPVLQLVTKVIKKKCCVHNLN
jgi:hypothetical protein